MLSTKIEGTNSSIKIFIEKKFAKNEKISSKKGRKCICHTKKKNKRTNERTDKHKT